MNDVKIYNLSAGKSLPDWLSSRRKRKVVKHDSELRNRIQLIQDFEMPGVSSCVKVSPDGQFVLVTGVYKPRVRCYDVNQLALKFERCMDTEVVRFEILSEDYSKLVFLQSDRYVEFHAQFGRYHRLRIPKAGHDMCYDKQACDLYLVGQGPNIYRLNLELGKFSETLTAEASSINTCKVNPLHNLFVCGTDEGTVEAWDPRSSRCVSRVDCALSSVTLDTDVDGMPSVTSLAFRDGLTMAVGTATGQILLYDIRARKPYTVKDHMYGLPIKKIEFLPGLDLIASVDCKILKMWERSTGKPYTAIQTASDLNDLCVVPGTGMMFLANEDKKVLTYYLPSLGPAPRWCSFLDRLVEELEENSDNTVYEDYKFVTEKELDELGLSHLMGTNLLRAYMHGFFMDMRLYHKAKAVSDPFAYDEYKRKKIREKLEAERGDRVQIKSKLPQVNRELAAKLLARGEQEEREKDDDELAPTAEEEEEEGEQRQSVVRQKSTAAAAAAAACKSRRAGKRPQISLLHDERFKSMFENPDFQVDQQSEEYKSITKHKAA